MRRILACLAVALALMGCTLGEIFADYGDPVDLRPEDVVGTWRSGADPHPRLITFSADGTFIATDLPNLHSSHTDFSQGNGKWSITDKQSQVHLLFERLGDEQDVRMGITIDALRQDDGKVWLIFFDFGSGAGHTGYEKCAEAACTPVTGRRPTG